MNIFCLRNKRNPFFIYIFCCEPMKILIENKLFNLYKNAENKNCIAIKMENGDNLEISDQVSFCPYCGKKIKFIDTSNFKKIIKQIENKFKTKIYIVENPLNETMLIIINDESLYNNKDFIKYMFNLTFKMKKNKGIEFEFTFNKNWFYSTYENDNDSESADTSIYRNI